MFTIPHTRPKNPFSFFVFIAVLGSLIPSLGCTGSGMKFPFTSPSASASPSASPTPSPSSSADEGASAIAPENSFLISAWRSGSDLRDLVAVYGTQGVASGTTQPGNRIGAFMWSDSNDNIWLFGGWGLDGSSNEDSFNDLWMYNTTTKQWMWVGGSNTQAAAGVYGTKGVANAANIPGARSSGIVWKDSSGTFWLFGGWGYDSAGAVGFLADLWSFDPNTHHWTWISGPDTKDELPVNGTQGVASASSQPGGRWASHGWIDSSDRLWLFGGNNPNSDCNDIWMFNPNTGQWMYKGGENSTAQNGVYGTKGLASGSNWPGSRYGATFWTDSQNLVWMFGGEGNDSSAGGKLLNDLWTFNPNTEQWTWVEGSQTGNVVGTYNSLFQSASTSTPGARSGSIGWIDSDDKLWIFGGYGRDSNNQSGSLNDLWFYDTSVSKWTWAGGQKVQNSAGNFGVMDVAADANTPSARGGNDRLPASVQMQNHIWMYGGIGRDSSGTHGYLSDLWDLQIKTSNTTPVIVAASSLQPGASIALNAYGGSAPYTFSILRGGGSFDSSTHLFTAPVDTASIYVKVEDGVGEVGYALITTTRTSLSLATSSSSTTPGATVTLTASGGSLPYVYSIVSGGGSINSSTGALTLAAVEGTTVARVTDGFGSSADVTITQANLSTYTYDASDQYYVVPNTGVTKLLIKAWGAGGGHGLNGGSGGGGGFASATLTVTPGEVIRVIVGGAANGNVGGIGGTSGTFNGGSGPDEWTWKGGGGGAASVIQSGSTTLLVAGGGGGGGGAMVNNDPTYALISAGGAGGGDNGTAAGTCSDPTDGTGGLGGLSGSNGGTGGGLGSAAVGSGIAGSNGSASGTGGNGGSSTPGDATGGGGGGGYFGGGGGGGGGGCIAAGGGGGGSSFYEASRIASATTPTLTSGSSVTAGNTGDSDYVSGVGRGQLYDASTTSGNGLVVITGIP